MKISQIAVDRILNRIKIYFIKKELPGGHKAHIIFNKIVALVVYQNND